MSLDDLLSDVEGIGEDRYVPSAPPRAILMDDHAAKDSLPPAGLKHPEVEASQSHSPSREPSESLDMVLDVDFELTVRLGQTDLSLKELMSLRTGSQFMLDQHPEAPLDIYVDDQLIARGEALIVDGMLAVQIVQLLKS